jgi:hypothetical protein
VTTASRARALRAHGSQVGRLEPGRAPEVLPTRSRMRRRPVIQRNPSYRWWRWCSLWPPVGVYPACTGGSESVRSRVLCVAPWCPIGEANMADADAIGSMYTVGIRCMASPLLGLARTPESENSWLPRLTSCAAG